MSLSVEEVQTFLSLIAEERIQGELDGDAEGKSLMYILFNLLYFQIMSSVFIFTFVCVFCFN